MCFKFYFNFLLRIFVWAFDHLKDAFDGSFRQIFSRHVTSLLDGVFPLLLFIKIRKKKKKEKEKRKKKNRKVSDHCF